MVIKIMLIKIYIIFRLTFLQFFVKNTREKLINDIIISDDITLSNTNLILWFCIECWFPIKIKTVKNNVTINETSNMALNKKYNLLLLKDK